MVATMMTMKTTMIDLVMVLIIVIMMMIRHWMPKSLYTCTWIVFRLWFQIVNWPWMLFGCLQHLAIILLRFLKFIVEITAYEIYYKTRFSKMFKIFFQKLHLEEKNFVKYWSIVLTFESTLLSNVKKLLAIFSFRLLIKLILVNHIAVFFCQSYLRK